MDNFTLAGLGVAALTLGVTNGVKSLFNLSGKTNQSVAIITGIIFTSLSYGISNGLIAQDFIPYVEWVVISIAGGLSAIGVFDFVKTDLMSK